jgi:hypothetical protein
MAHWPSGAGPAAHFAPAVQRAMPLGSPLAQTLGSTQDPCWHSYASDAAQSKLKSCQFSERARQTFGQGRQEPASANEGGHRPQAGDEPKRSRPSAFESNRGGGMTMRQARKNSANRTAGCTGQKTECQDRVNFIGGSGQGPEQSKEREAAGRVSAPGAA